MLGVACRCNYHKVIPSHTTHISLSHIIMYSSGQELREQVSQLMKEEEQISEGYVMCANCYAGMCVN